MNVDEAEPGTDASQPVIDAAELRKRLLEAPADGSALVFESGALIAGDLDLSATTVHAELRFIGCRFTGQLSASAALLVRPTTFTTCVFEQSTNLNHLHASSNLSVTGSSFGGPVTLDDAHLEQDLDARGAEFHALSMQRTEVDGETRFDSLADKQPTTFRGPADFARARFHGAAVFDGAAFGDGMSPSFEQAVFDGPASFRHDQWEHPTIFRGDARFSSAHFNSSADFERAEFGARGTVLGKWQGTSVFREATFADRADFGGAWFGNDVSFEHAQLNGPAYFGPSWHGPDPAGKWLPRPATFAAQARFSRVKFSSSADFANVEFEGNASYNGTVFGADAFFGGAHFRTGSDWIDARFDGPAHFSSAADDKCGFTATTTFGAAANFASARFATRVDFDNTEFEAPVGVGTTADSSSSVSRPRTLNPTFHGAYFGGDASFQGAQFKDSAAFDSAHFAGRAFFRFFTFRLNECQPRVTQFFEDARFLGVTFAGPAFFERTIFGGVAEFSQARFQRIAFFPSVHFGGRVEFSNVRVDGPAIFGTYGQHPPVQFQGFVRFVRTEISGPAIFFRAQFVGAEPAWVDAFDPATKGPPTSAIFHGSVFKGDLDCQGATFAHQVEFDGATVAGRAFFRPWQRGRAETAASFAGDAFFRGTQFNGQTSFEVARFAHKAVFAHAAFGSAVTFAGAVFAGLAEFNGAEIKGDAVFQGARFGKCGASFREATCRAVFLRDHLTRHIPAGELSQFEGPVDLRGFTFTRLYAAWQELLDGAVRWENSPRPGDPKRGDTQAARPDVHERQPWTQLESSMRAMGRDADADSVFYRLRRHEWRRFWSLKHPWNVIRGVVDTLYWWLALYGIRPIPLFVIALVWLAVGWNVFRYQGAVVPKQTAQAAATQPPASAAPITLDDWDAAGMSLNLLAPIELWPSEWKPSREPVPILHGLPNVETLIPPVPAQVYALFHKAFGWLTVPLAVASLTGLLQRRPKR